MQYEVVVMGVLELLVEVKNSLFEFSVLWLSYVVVLMLLCLLLP
ncbi:hypothetical protein SLEP1_g53745 [Rubroshorea leprosula]|uniref:Uncharacterized protein n=1 Tax=Rubroshorea leprosula TaxID=152421 RepID=A0AAV5MA79_9ROSI|nr:hypothetical protein SLEP1_g53745 [Rubroshorea leprosula]